MDATLRHLADSLAFFVLPADGADTALPDAPQEPTIFGAEAAIRALRAGQTLGISNADGSASNVVLLAFEYVGGLPVGEDVAYHNTTLAHGYLTISLWRATPGRCSFCDRPGEPPARPIAKGRGGVMICLKCAEVSHRALLETQQTWGQPIPEPGAVISHHRHHVPDA